MENNHDPNSSVEDCIATFIHSLPFLSKDVLDAEDSCPICLTSFEALLETDAVEGNEECGVTKLDCGHIFCRKDLLEWIRNLHGSCPTCRSEFLDIHPTQSDDEYSSDGGEYMPGSDDETEEEDGFLDTSEFTDPDFDMEIDSDDIWERSDGDEMQISPEFEPSTEGDEQDGGFAVEVYVSVTDGDDDQEFFDDSSDEIQAEEPKSTVL
ncbi:hypothetical protein DFH07DRAFT_834492 [Mycena maculata]|uniref:RING-type domain-containing protein n=1 Tax=Mycena maculata TaxID=230809 RepID=A0AAD7N3U4_9AGAR|nr:hypothetical protein DFH07DRAFT_834492 [Mycena maculata]